MRLIDTHSHIYDADFDSDIQEVIDRATDNGVIKILLPNVDSESIKPMMNLAEKFDFLYPMMGLHPTSIKEDWENELSVVKSHLFSQSDKFCAVGEIGIDLYWDKTFVEEQMEAFKAQMMWSFDLELPVSVHNRKGFDEMFAVLKSLNRPSYNGVLHCFGGDLRQAEKLIEMGFLIGIGGVVTFKNAHLAELIKSISLDKIVLETDAPYLAPVPFRGKRNESGYVLYIAEMISKIKGVTLEEVAERTTIAALNLFPRIA
jgi:TatD DNase family protein